MLLSTFAIGATALCPFMAGNGGGHADLRRRLQSEPEPAGFKVGPWEQPGEQPAMYIPNRGPVPALRNVPKGHRKLVENLDWEAVKTDLKALFLESQDFWPADYGNYAPFFVRLAWHNSGSYRISDGRGGADGGRQRFDPERSWDDNTNLDKARKLLQPIKIKYGAGLSWGDLIILAGNTAIESMNGPILGFCAGRVDDPDGFWSEELGPTHIQELREPCEVNGTCQPPLGSSTIGLIYLNPEGPLGQPIPEDSAHEVRDTFGRMNMNDTETVALIGGGHAFGKTHGACPDGAGPSPMNQPDNPWPGMCGTGKAADAFTSGFEGPWTTKPTVWDNEYYKNLLNVEWESHTGPGGHYQWRAKDSTEQPMGPAPFGDGSQATMMLTTDVSLTKDPTGKYQTIVEHFAEDFADFDRQFEAAWYKLTTRDMGPVTRCLGPDVPPAQDWQYPLPEASKDQASYCQVKKDLKTVIKKAMPSIIAPDSNNGMTSYAGLFVRLAWQCASTFRVTDWLGGCNGARLRFSPQKDFAENKDLDKALELLNDIKESYGESLSWSDLIVAAGYAAIEDAGGLSMPFCSGRTDATEGFDDLVANNLRPRVNGTDADTLDRLKQQVLLSGLTNREYVALMGGRHSIGTMMSLSAGFEGSWTTNPFTLDNEYFTNLLTQNWVPVKSSTGETYYKAAEHMGKSLHMLKTDLLLMYEPEWLAIAQDYASDNDMFLREFAAAWVKAMNSDRFDGPTSNVCESVQTQNCEAKGKKAASY